VGVLQAFERRLGGLVEGAFAKVFKGDVQPVEIAGALQREADDRKAVVGQGRILAPNDYVVELGDHDYGRLEEWAEPLGDELAAMVREHAAEAGYSFVGPVHVEFEHHPEVGTGVFRVRSNVAASTEPPAPPQAASTPPRPAPAGAYPDRPRLIVAVGQDESAYFLSHPVTVIGRAAESDIRIDDPGVSRRHAELRYADGEVELIDLGSTNGLAVNGIPTLRAVLRDSDRIDVASTTLIFRRDED
jgi:FHA domain-containing protein